MSMSKEELHRLIGRLSDEQLKRLTDALPNIVIPIDDEPLTEEDVRAIDQARDEFARGEFIPLDELLSDFNGDKKEDRRV